MLVLGINETEFRQSAKLPEGMYTVCIQVMDYRRRDVMLANEHCSMAVLQFNNPPTNVFPACEQPLVVMGDMQSVKFQWQANHDRSLMTQYRLTVVEVSEGINPNDAINGASTPMLDGELINTNYFTYGPEQLPFEHGKTYAYRIDIYDETGFTTFENEGFGEVCSFTYGAGVGGTIQLNSPANEARVKPGNPPVFQWNAPSNALAGTPFYYKIRVVPFVYGEDPLTAYLTNPPYTDEQTEELTQMGAWNYFPSAPLPAETQFAWKVEAYLPIENAETGGDLMIAESPLNVFMATPLVDQFNVNEHVVEVITTNGTTAENLSGVGRVILVPDEDPYEISFSNLNVTVTGKGNFLYSGTIDSPVKELSLALDFDKNGDARFNAKRVILDRNQFKLEGQVQWDLPHAVDAENVMPKVESKEAIFDYQDFKLKGKTPFDPTGFNLLDPYHFQLHYNEQSIFEIENFPNLKATMNGYVALPKHSQTTEESLVKIEFVEVDNPFWFYGNQKTDFKEGIHLINNTSIRLLPKKTLIDFSNKQSAFSKVDDKYWKGVVFETYDVVFSTAFDKSGQLKLNQNLLFQFNANLSTDNYAYCEDRGLSLSMDRSFEKRKGPTASFNTFLDNLTEVKIHIDQGSVTDSYIGGYVYVPLLSQTKTFDYQLPMDDEGLQPAFLEGIEGYTKIFNEDEGTEIKLLVNQGHFEENNRLSLNVDVIIPGFGVELLAVENFTIWGNGNVGFDGVPGKSIDLPENTMGLLGGSFPLYMKGIGFAALPREENTSTGALPDFTHPGIMNTGLAMSGIMKAMFPYFNDELEVTPVDLYASVQFDMPMGDDLSSDEGGSPETATVINMGSVIVVSGMKLNDANSTTTVTANDDLEITSGTDTAIEDEEVETTAGPALGTVFGGTSSVGTIFEQISTWNNEAYTNNKDGTKGEDVRTYSGASELGVLPVGIGIPPVAGLFSVTVGDVRYTKDHPFWGTMFGMKISINISKPKQTQIDVSFVVGYKRFDEDGDGKLDSDKNTMETIVERLHGSTRDDLGNEAFADLENEILTTGGYHYFSIYSEVSRPDEATSQEAALIANGEFQPPPQIFKAVMPHSLKTESDSKIGEIKEGREYDNIDEMLGDQEAVNELLRKLEADQVRYNEQLAAQQEELGTLVENGNQLQAEINDLLLKPAKLQFKKEIYSQWRNLGSTLEESNFQGLSEEDVSKGISNLEEQIAEKQGEIDRMGQEGDKNKALSELNTLKVRKAKYEVIQDNRDVYDQQTAMDEQVAFLEKEWKAARDEANEMIGAKEALKEFQDKKEEHDKNNAEREKELTEIVEKIYSKETNDIKVIKEELQENENELYILEYRKKLEREVDEGRIDELKNNIANQEVQLEKELGDLQKKFSETEEIMEVSARIKTEREEELAELIKAEERVDRLEEKVEDLRRREQEKLEKLEKQIADLETEKSIAAMFEKDRPEWVEVKEKERLAAEIENEGKINQEFFKEQLAFEEDLHKSMSAIEEEMAEDKRLDLELAKKEAEGDGPPVAGSPEEARYQKIKQLESELEELEQIKEQGEKERKKQINELKSDLEDKVKAVEKRVKPLKDDAEKARERFFEKQRKRHNEIQKLRREAGKIDLKNTEHYNEKRKQLDAEVSRIFKTEQAEREKNKRKRQVLKDEIADADINSLIKKAKKESTEKSNEKKVNDAKEKKAKKKVSSTESKLKKIADRIRYINDPDYREEQKRKRKEQEEKDYDLEIELLRKKNEDHQKEMDDLLVRQAQGDDVAAEIEALENAIKGNKESINQLENEKNRFNDDPNDLADDDESKKKSKDDIGKSKGFAIGFAPFQIANMRFMYYKNMSYEMYVPGSVEEDTQTRIGVASTGDFILKPRFDAGGGAIGGKFLIGQDEDIFLDFNGGIEIINKQVARVRFEVGGGQEEKFEIYGEFDANWIDQRYVGGLRGYFKGGGMCGDGNVSLDIDLKNKIFRGQLGSRDEKLHLYIKCVEKSESFKGQTVSAEAGVGVTGWVDVLFDQESKLATSTEVGETIGESDPSTIEFEIGFGAAVKVEAKAEMVDVLLAYVSPYVEIIADAGVRFRMKLAAEDVAEIEGGVFLDVDASAGVIIIWKATDKRENLSLFTLSAKVDANYKAILLDNPSTPTDDTGHYFSGMIVGEASLLSLPPATIEFPFETKLGEL